MLAHKIIRALMNIKYIYGIPVVSLYVMAAACIKVYIYITVISSTPCCVTNRMFMHTHVKWFLVNYYTAVSIASSNM